MSLDSNPPFPPLFADKVSAGFASVSEDYIESYLNLQELMVKNPIATFFVRVEGESMLQASISPGDILVVDRSLEATSGKIVIASINGEFTVKRLQKTERGIVLKSENPAYPSIPIHPESDFHIWGVVTYVIHKT